MRARSPSPVRAIVAGILAILAAASPITGQEGSRQSGTYAGKGFTIGAVTGGIVGGLSFFLLGGVACESSSCTPDAFELGMLGAVVGAAGGGLTGLVIGAAIPRRGGQATDATSPDSASDTPSREQVTEPATRWSTVISLGPSLGNGDDLPGTSLWAGVALLRPTTSRVRWGVEVGYLGRRSTRHVYTDSISGLPPTTYRSAASRTVWSASLMALKAVGAGPEPTMYILGSVGVYPLRESVRYSRSPTVPGGNGSWTESTPFPGLSLGGGGAWPVSRGAALGIESRLHVILGVDDGAAGILTLGGTLRLGR